MRIIEGDLSNQQVIDLLNEHLRGVAAISPPRAVHALDHDGLRGPGITFWTIWTDDPENAVVLGCGALKQLDPQHAEIKSMRTAHDYLRQGVASRMLQHLIDIAAARAYNRLSLETGSGPAFEPACALYRKFGFVECGPFGEYHPNAFSRFMTRTVGECPQSQTM